MSALPGFKLLPIAELGSLFELPDRTPKDAWASKPATLWPPGNAGQLARFIFGTAHRPVPEVAIVAALGWLAGVSGKAYTTPSLSGLNVYVILVARSAIGKETMHSGLSLLTSALVDKGCSFAERYITFDRFASGPALRKAVALRSSFVQVNGEWGLTLKAMLSSSRQPDGPLQTLKAEMTNLYQKSGPEARAGATRYSDEKKNEATVNVGSVAFSMIGETTPDTFRAAQSSDMMEDGFASRFSVVEYMGARPPENEMRVTTPSDELVAWCTALVLQVETLLAAKGHQAVEYSPDARALRKAFNGEADTQINATDDNALRQVWNRADLKVQKVACLLAVADDALRPVVSVDHMLWAIALVRKDIAMYQQQLAAGDVGADDHARDRKLLAFCKAYLVNGKRDNDVRVARMATEGVITRRYLQQRTSNVPAFTGYQYGPRRAFDDAMRSLCASGYLMAVDKLKAADSFGFQGECYRIVYLPDGSLD